MDQLPRLGKKELVILLLFTCSFVVSVLGRFLFLLVLGMDCAFFIVALPGPSINYFTRQVALSLHQLGSLRAAPLIYHMSSLFVCLFLLRLKYLSNVGMEPPLPGYYLLGVKCLAQGHKAAEVGFKPPTSCIGVLRSTTEPSCSQSTHCFMSICFS